MFRLTSALAFSAAFSITTIASAVNPAVAIEYPWCVEYGSSDDGGGRNCGFVSYEQCMMSARGAGGWCVQNLFYPDEVAKRRPQAKRKPKQER